MYKKETEVIELHSAILFKVASQKKENRRFYGTPDLYNA